MFAIHGNVHLLFNNAGVRVAETKRRIWTLPAEDWQWAFAFWNAVIPSCPPERGFARDVTRTSVFDDLVYSRAEFTRDLLGGVGMSRESQWRKFTKLGLIVVAATSSSWGSRASAQEEAIPDSVAADVAGSTTKPVGEARFAAPPADFKEGSADEAAAAAEGEPKAEVDWALSAGGAINSGNTRSWNINGGTDFLLSKEDHRLTITSIFNMGRANPSPSDPASSYTTVAKQFFFNSRYDYFFTKMDAVWSSLAYRWDPLAGFTAQLLANGGYLRAFIKTEKHYLAGRIGYSYTYENYKVPPSDLVGSSNIQGLLAALDYENRLNEHVEFVSSITTVYNLNRVDVQDADAFEDVRIYLTAALVSKLTDKLAFEARFLMLYDRIPAGLNLVNTDTTTIFSLVYTLM